MTLLYFDIVDSEKKSKHPISKTNPNKIFRYLKLIKTAQNSNITIKFKIGPFLANNTIIVTASIRLKTNIVLETAECFCTNTRSGPADRIANEAPAGRGFLENREIPSELLNS